MSDQHTLIGKWLKTYEIQALVGRGGMASVFKAFDHNLQRLVAIKVLSAAAAAQHGFAERFRQEALLIARLHHPNIVQVYDYGEQDGLTFMVEELLPGPSLGEQIARANAQQEHLPREQVLKIVGDIASGLAAAHKAGIIHRDIKPDNAIWNARGDLVLTDFGIARVLTAADSGYTQTGTIVGTPNYMSPEQAQGLLLTPASDVYSLGVMLYELLAGRVPFAGANPIAVVMDHVQTPPPPLRPLRPDLPPPVEAVVLQALAKRPTDRFSSPMELAGALARAWPVSYATTAFPVPEVNRRPTTVWPEPPAARPAAPPQIDAVGGEGGRLWMLLGLIGGLALLLLCGAAMAARGLLSGDGAPTPVPTIVAALPPAEASATSGPTATAEATATVEPTLEPTVPPTETPVPVPVALTKPVVFQTMREGDWDIGVANPDGSGFKLLTEDRADDVSPDLSPDGQRIAFQSKRTGREQIFVMNADGSDQRNISNTRYDARDPAWSPDGRFIVYYARPFGNWDLFIMNADGSTPVQLTSDLSDEFLPVWSPDGQWIAFTANAGRNDEIHIVRPNGADRRNLSNSSAADKAPGWSPDSQQIAFSTDRDGNFEIYVMDLEGGNLRNLSNHPAGETQPVWSTDGQYIAFVTNRDDKSEVYRMRADGSEQVNISLDPAHDSEPSWAR